MTGHVSCLQAAITASSRSAARRAGTWTLHPIRCGSTSIPASVHWTRNRRATRSAIRASVQHWSSSHPQTAGPASSAVSSSASWPWVSLHLAPPAPLAARAWRPPAASARRHRFADIRDTRSRVATSRSLAPDSISSAASSRTRSRRARSATVRPPPSGYLMTPAYLEMPATARGSNLRN